MTCLSSLLKTKVLGFLSCTDIKLISRNTVKPDVLSMYQTENVRIMNLLNSIPKRMSLTTDLWTSVATMGMYI